MSTPTADTQVTGTVRVAGTGVERYTTLRVEGARPITLVGDLESELRQLSGATVRITGHDAGTGPLGRRVDVQRYEVLSIDGQTPVVGTLRVQEAGVWIVAADTVPLENVPGTLRAQDGAKVWVTGRRTERGLEVQRYGVLRPAR